MHINSDNMLIFILNRASGMLINDMLIEKKNMYYESGDETGEAMVRLQQKLTGLQQLGGDLSKKNKGGCTISMF